MPWERGHLYVDALCPESEGIYIIEALPEGLKGFRVPQSQYKSYTSYVLIIYMISFHVESKVVLNNMLGPMKYSYQKTKNKKQK